MKLGKRVFIVALVLLFSSCTKFPGTAGSGYRLEGYNNSGYTGDRPHMGGFDDTSLQDARKERLRAEQERIERRDSR